MLLQFAVRNYKTFKDEAVLSLVASNYDKDFREQENVVAEAKYGLRLLKSAVVFGANASGKSKLLDAFAFMRYFVLNSSKESQNGDAIDVHPFRLSTQTEDQASEFEAVFIHQGVQYRYGFEAARDRIVSEWLYHKPKTKEVELFYREGEQFRPHARAFPKGSKVIKEGLVRGNALLVSVAAQFNEASATQVLDWFKRTKTLSSLKEVGYQSFTYGKMEDADAKAKIMELLKAADLGILDAELQKMTPEELPEAIPQELRDWIAKQSSDEKRQIVTDVLTRHKKYDAQHDVGGKVSFSMAEDESAGTRKFFALAGPILDVLQNGYLLLVDELDAQLHPSLVNHLVALFNSREHNPNNAQLVFNTHNISLLDSTLFRRDQIWFTEKDRRGEAKLYSLADFKSDDARKNASFQESYTRGRYGAVPFLGFFEDLKIVSIPEEDEKAK